MIISPAMVPSSLLIIAAAAGFKLAAANDIQPTPAIAARQDTNQEAAQTAAPSITLQAKAVEPTCVTSVWPASSSCNIGVHTEPGAENTLVTRALPATCETFWSTTTNCQIGVHPQPTDISVTVTKTSEIPNAAPVTSVVTTAAQASIVAPASGGDDALGFVLTPDLRNNIINVINAACPKKLKARDDIELVDLACTLPESSWDGVIAEIQPLIGDSLAFDSKALASLFATGLTTEQIKTSLIGLFAWNVLMSAVGNGRLPLSSNMVSSVYKPILSNPNVGKPPGSGGT